MAKATKATKATKEVKVDRRAKDRRATADRRQKNVTVDTDRRQGERREKVSRRRQIDPTTCERDYTEDEVEFMQALDEYKRQNGRMFPTCSEILEVIRDLGYAKVSADTTPAESNHGDADDAAATAEDAPATNS